MTATETMHDVPTTPDEKIGSVAHQESTVHFVAREARRVAVWGILIFAVVTAITAVTAIFWIIPAAILVVNVVLFGVATIVESMTRKPGDPHEETAEEQQARQAATSSVATEESRRLEKKELIADAVTSHTAKIVAGLLAGLTVLALLLAGIVLQPQLVLIGGMILVAYMLLVAAPAWLGWLNEEAEEVEHEVERDAKAGEKS